VDEFELRLLTGEEQRRALLALSRLFFGTDVDDPVPVPELLALSADRYGGYRALAVHYVWEENYR
jgi:hypothetical protein